jgi:hypothetical protein
MTWSRSDIELVTLLQREQHLVGVQASCIMVRREKAHGV